MKDNSIDIVYQKLLEDLKQYCTEQEIEEECREYAEKKKRDPHKNGGGKPHQREEQSGSAFIAVMMLSVWL